MTHSSSEIDLAPALGEVIQKSSSPALVAVRDDPKLYGFLIGILSSNIDLIGSKNTTEVVFAMAHKTAGTMSLAADKSSSQGLKVGVSSAQIILQSASMIKLAGSVSPGIAITQIGAMFTKKVSLAMGLAENNQQAKCIAAMSDLASGVLSTGASVALLSASSGGVMAPLAVVAGLAQIGLAGYESYQACKSPEK